MDYSDYPASPGPYKGFSPIYFGCERRVKSVLNFVGHDDRGVLEMSPKRLVFTGMEVLVDCPNVTSIDMVGEPFQWPGLLGVSLVLIVMVYMSGDFGGIPWGHPLVVPGMVIFMAIVGATSRRSWVKVDYLDAIATPHCVYFKYESPFFPSRRATIRLYNEMRSKILGS